MHQNVNTENKKAGENHEKQASMQFSLRGKRVLLTGGASGIGYAVLQLLLKSGAIVLSTVSSEEKAIKLEKQGVKAFVLDLAHITENDANQMIDQLEGIDILIHCAGVAKDNLLLRMSEDEWDNVHDVNLKAAFILTKSAIKNMLRKGGQIIYVTSVVARAGNVGQANYIASKAGLAGLARSVAVEYGARGVSANCVEPGFIETNMTRNLPQAVKDTILSKIPSKRMGTVEEVANCIVFLACSSYVNGSTLRVNGGMFMD